MHMLLRTYQQLPPEGVTGIGVVTHLMANNLRGSLHKEANKDFKDYSKHASPLSLGKSI
jgi:hypothetical protein